MLRAGFMVSALAALLFAGLATGSMPGTPAEAAAVKWVNVIVRTPEGGVRQGNPAAKVKLIEYGSRSCPVCGAFANTGVAPLRAKYVATGKVSYEYREMWVHPQDPGLSQLGQCVPTPKFFAVLDAMYAKQSEFNARANQDMYDKIGALPVIKQPAEWARQLGYPALLIAHGIPAAQVNQCLADLPALGRIEQRVKDAFENKGVRGTPTFFVNGRRIDNAISWEQLEPELKASGA